MFQIPTNHAANPQIQNISFKPLHLSKAKTQRLTTTGGNQFLKYYSKNNMEEKIVPLCTPVVPREAENERWKAFDPRLTHFYSILAVSSDSGHHNNNIQKESIERTQKVRFNNSRTDKKKENGNE